MTKVEFLEKLRKGLSGLPREDVEERLQFYSEVIDDRMEEGLSEEEAVAGIGLIDKIVIETVSDVPMRKLVKERIKPKRALKGWEILLLVLGFPVWFPLILAAAAILLSLFVVLFAVVISLWAIDLSCGLAGVGGVILAAIYLFTGIHLPSLAMFGIGVFGIGFSILAFWGCVGASKGMPRVARGLLYCIKRLFVGREKAQ